MHSENWDDLRFVLAVAEHGTVSGAARALNVNHATVLRRIAAFEDRYGAPVFQRGPSGYVVRPDRVRMIEAARDVDHAVRSVGNLMRGIQAPLTGRVRITSTDTLCRYVLPEVLSGFRGRQEGLHISLLSTNAHLDFSRAHADITVRPTQGLAQDLVGVPAVQLGFGVFARPDAPDAWLGMAGVLGGLGLSEILRNSVPADQIVGSADSFIALAEMARHGFGKAILPMFVGAGDPDLMHLPNELDLPDVPIWVASHKDMADVSRIAATCSYLVDALRERADALGGRKIS